GRGGPDALDEGTGGRPVVGGRLPGDPAGRALRRVGADGPDVHVDAEPVAGVAGDGPAMLEADVTERYLAVAGGGERGDRRFQLTDRRTGAPVGGAVAVRVLVAHVRKRRVGVVPDEVAPGHRPHDPVGADAGVA